MASFVPSLYFFRVCVCVYVLIYRSSENYDKQGMWSV
jgi:hypothetical protein